MTDQTKPMDAERIAEMRDRQPIRVVCGHCSEDVSNAPQVQRAERDIHDLLAEVARLTAEREEYERTRWTVVAQRNGALNDLETANAELSRLRAVIEEARKALSLNGSFYTPRAVVISMLKL